MNYTREDYLNEVCTHREYYPQFVDSSVIERVVQRVGGDRLKQSNDPCFNYISLDEWDKLYVPGKHESLSQAICIHKEAARQYVETEMERVK